MPLGMERDRGKGMRGRRRQLESVPGCTLVCTRPRCKSLSPCMVQCSPVCSHVLLYPSSTPTAARRTRGIPGYTGVQPALEVSRPPPPAEEQEDISRLTSINGLDAPRPRVKGIPGYTGHQPPAPDKREWHRL